MLKYSRKQQNWTIIFGIQLMRKKHFSFLKRYIANSVTKWENKLLPQKENTNNCTFLYTEPYMTMGTSTQTKLLKIWKKGQMAQKFPGKTLFHSLPEVAANSNQKL